VGSGKRIVRDLHCSQVTRTYQRFGARLVSQTIRLCRGRTAGESIYITQSDIFPALFVYRLIVMGESPTTEVRIGQNKLLLLKGRETSMVPHGFLFFTGVFDAAQAPCSYEAKSAADLR
jgi:hypothetical protein